MTILERQSFHTQLLHRPSWTSLSLQGMAPKFVFKHLKKQQAAKSAATSAVKASQLSPKAAARSTKAPAEAPVEISVCRYISASGILLNALPEPLQEEPLHQVQLRHDAKPSLLMRAVMNFQTYLGELHGQQQDVPASLNELRDAGITLQIAGSQHEGGGVIPWRVAFYVAGDEAALLNGLRLINSFLEWRARHPGDGEAPFPQTTSVQLAVPTALHAALSQEEWVLPTTVSMPPRFPPFQAAPPTGRALSFMAEFGEDGKTMQGVFEGATWPFRAALEDQNVLGARTDDDVYVRVVAPIDTSLEKDRTWFLGTILRDTFKELVLNVKVVTQPPRDSAAYDFLGLLLDLPQAYLLT